ncbi:MAG: tRNA glutamyl-Q(34) synthetase GluQRS [Proteobacteria bacterium]|nr:tRNA glutamyl-Q(34) synthetase GluQRS [Pseudomonadota bacterium]
MTLSKSQPCYIGRFAPSPTGPLHLGSLLAAMASYCDAMNHQGKWLVRIEDLDPPREIKGASQQILTTLNKLGFEFDQNTLFQSQRQQSYEDAINKLMSLSALYYCNCSRNNLKNITTMEHKCRNTTQQPSQPHSIKLKVPDKTLSFVDEIQGTYSKNLLEDCGDFVIKRKDGLHSYQLAVVVDDAYQGVTHIVRGTDLIDSTPWQIYLQLLLNFDLPIYAHIPILVNSDNQKLSKQTFAKPIDNEDPLSILLTAYQYLGQQPFNKRPTNIKQFWQHAIQHWDINKVSKVNAFQV